MPNLRRNVRQTIRRVRHRLLQPVGTNRLSGQDNDQVPLLGSSHNTGGEIVVCMITSELPPGPESPLEGMPFSPETHALLFGGTSRKNKVKEDSESEYEEHGKKRKLNKNGEPRKVRKPRGALRQWDDQDVARALMGLVWAAGENHIRLPFDQAAQMVGQNCTASALQQAILKIHSRLNDQGAQIPKIKMNWPSKVANPSSSNDGDRDLPKADRRRRHETSRKATQTCLVTLKCAYKPAGGDDTAQSVANAETSPGREPQDTQGHLVFAVQDSNLIRPCDMFTQQSPMFEQPFMSNQFANTFAVSDTNGYIPMPLESTMPNVFDMNQASSGLNNMGSHFAEAFPFDAAYASGNVLAPAFQHSDGAGVVSDTFGIQDQMHTSANGSDSSSFQEMIPFDREDDRMFGGVLRNPLTSHDTVATTDGLSSLGAQHLAWTNGGNNEYNFQVGNPYERNAYGVPYHSFQTTMWDNMHGPEHQDPEYWTPEHTRIKAEE